MTNHQLVAACLTAGTVGILLFLALTFTALDIPYVNHTAILVISLFAFVVALLAWLADQFS